MKYAWKANTNNCKWTGNCSMMSNSLSVCSKVRERILTQRINFRRTETYEWKCNLKRSTSRIKHHYLDWVSETKNLANFTSKVSTHTGYTPASMAFHSDLPTSNARAIKSHHMSLLPAVLSACILHPMLWFHSLRSLSVFIPHQTTRLWGQEPALVCSPICRGMACSKCTNKYLVSEHLCMWEPRKVTHPLSLQRSGKLFRKMGHTRGRKASHLTLY